METNKLIAEFMGQVNSNDTFTSYGNYHCSWDWLMPVVEKIRCLNAEDTIVPVVENVNINMGVDCDIEVYMDRSIQFHTEYSKSNIEMVYEAVVDFITWYNEQEK